MIITPELLDKYIANCAMFLAPRTIQHYRDNVKRFMLWLNNRDVTEELITGYTNHLLTECGLHRNTVVAYRKIVRIFFNYLIALRLWKDRNPVIKNRSMFTIPNEREIFTIQEYIALCSAARNYYPESYYLIVVLGWSTGLRAHDVLHMAWNNVDFVNRSIRIVPNKTKKFGKRVEIPMTEELRFALSEYRLKHVNDLYLFPDIISKYLPGIFRKICHRANIKKSFHCFRHTFVTRLLEAGVITETICAMTGHRPEEVMSYQHIGLETKRKAILEAI